MKNRKEAECPKCERVEIIAAENELIKCSRCALLGAEAWAKKNNMPSGKELQKTMEAKKISVRNLAYELGIAQSYLYEMINEKKPLNSKVYKWMGR